METRWVTLGRVAGAFGIKGWVKVHANSRPAGNILKYPRWFLKNAGYEASLIAGQMQGAAVVAHLSGADGQPLTDRDAALKLVGCEIQVERSAMPQLPKGQHYWMDLVGLKVENEQGEPLGTVSDMTSNGAQDVMVVQDGDMERLIPFVSGPIVKDVDAKAGRVVCDWQRDW